MHQIENSMTHKTNLKDAVDECASNDDVNWIYWRLDIQFVGQIHSSICDDFIF